MTLSDASRAYLARLLQAANQTVEAQAFQTALTATLIGLGLEPTPGRWETNLQTGTITDKQIVGPPAPLTSPPVPEA